MAASKTLILLKGIAGFAATSLATVGGFQVGHKVKTSNALSLEQNDEVTLYVEEEPQKYIERIDDLGIPDGCFTSACELNAEQLKNLKFEQRSSTSIAYDGLNNEDTFELTVEEVSEDTENYPHGKKFILKKKTTKEETIRIRNIKGDEIVLEEGEGGVEIREKEEGGWLEKVPEEVNGLGIPKRCQAGQDEESTEQTCELTKEQLLRLKFEPKDDEKITVEGQNEGNIVTLKIEDKKDDQTNYPNSKKYTLTSTSGTVTIRNVKDGDIVLEENKDVLIRETSDGNNLETVENSLGIPKWCNESCQLTQEQLQRLKFETKDDETSISVEGQNEGNIVTLKIEDKPDDKINYPKGKKYTLKSTATKTVTIKNVKEGDIEINEETGIVIREISKGGKLEKAPEEVNGLGIPKRCESETPCKLTAEQLQRLKFETKGNKKISVEGLSDGNKVDLTIEEKEDDKRNYPKGKKYTLKVTTEDKVKIKGLTGGDIEIGKEEVLIRETSKGGKLEEALEEVNSLGIPTRCTTTQACQLTKEQLKRLKFEAKTSSPITVIGLEKDNKVTLSVEDSNDTTNYPHGKKYTLTSTNSKVTIKGVKGGDIVLEAKQDVVIREKQKGSQLEKAPEEVDSLGIPTNCTKTQTCKLTREQLKKIKFEPKSGSSVWISGMGNSDKVTLKVEEPNDTDNYPQNKKYSFKVEKEGVTIKGTKDWDIDLEKDKEVLIREKRGGGKLETVEDSLGIPKSCNAKEVKKRPDVQTCQLSADQLKNIKFKAFGGKNAHVRATGLRDKIKLTISWVEDGSRYPDNKKYSFDNTNRNEKIKISKGREEVTLEEKKESWFKNNGGQLEFVEANTKSEVKMKETNEILTKLGLFEKLKLTPQDFTDNNSTWHKQKKSETIGESDLKKISFKALGGKVNEIVGGLSGTWIKVSFDWDVAANKYPNNMKFTFANTRISQYVELKGADKTSSIKLWKSTNLGASKHIYKVVDDQLVEA